MAESPGQTEIDSVPPEPLIGAAGFEVNRSLRSAGIARSNLYITNTVKCKPPADAKDWEWAEAIAHCSRAYLDKEIAAAGDGPKKILVLGGKAALRAFGRNPFDKPPSVTEIRGSLYRADDFRAWPLADLGRGQYAKRFFHGRDNVQILPTLHPAHIIRGLFKWRPVVARDYHRALKTNVLRPVPLPRVRPVTEVLKAPAGAEVLIDLETEWQTSAITLVGMLIGGEAYISRYSPKIIPIVSSILTDPDRTIVGHNIVSFDLPVLSSNKIEHTGSYFDTISLARLEEADLPVGLREVVSRNVPEYVFWKGLSLGGGLADTLRHVFDLKGFNEIPWDIVYNLIDIYWNAKAKAAMWNRMTPQQQDLFMQAHVATVPHRLAMHKRGVKWNRPYGERREVEIWEDQAAVGAEVMEIVDQHWDGRVEQQVSKVEFIDDQMVALSRRVTSAILTRCEKHPKFDGLRKVRAKHCQKCAELFSCRAAERQGYERYKKTRASMKNTLKTLEKGFNPQSSQHWAWLLFSKLKLHVKGLPATGREEWYTGLIRKPGKKLRFFDPASLSVDDDALAHLQRKLEAGGKASPLIDLRVKMTKNYKLLGTYFVPFNNRILLDMDDMGFPVYHDFKSRMGRWSGGGKEEGIDK